MITLEECAEYQRLYDVFRDHYDEGIRVLKEILGDETRKAQLEEATKIVAEAAHAVDLKTAPIAPNPAIRYFACLANLPRMRNGYLNRGFSVEEVERMMGCFGGSLNSSMYREGVFGYNLTYIWWTGLFITNEIFKFGDKEFELRTYTNKVTWLRHKETLEIRPLLMGGAIHKSGNILGSGGCTDEEGSFKVTFEETETAFIGNKIEDGLVYPETMTYEKKDWNLFLKPGDPVIAFHFPNKADISVEGLNAFFRDGLQAIRERYPEYKPVCYSCSSWLLDTKMQRFLKPTSNIVGFQNMMYTVPQKSDGMGVFGFVLPPSLKDDFSALPENTSLERGLKKLYLDGDRIYNRFGVRPFDLCR